MSSIPVEFCNIYPPEELAHYFKRRFNDISVILWDPCGPFFYVLFAGRLEEFYGPYNALDEVENFARQYSKFLNNAFGDVSNSVGQNAERRAFRLLNLLGLNARLATHEEDSKGWDLIVKECDREYPIQIKNSKDHKRRHRQKYPNVPCFVINDDRTDEEISNEFTRFFRAALFNVA